MISWKSQKDGDENKKYYLQFETDNEHYYKVMENVSQSLIDFENDTDDVMISLLKELLQYNNYNKIEPNDLLRYFIFLRLDKLKDKE